MDVLQSGSTILVDPSVSLIEDRGGNHKDDCVTPVLRTGLGVTVGKRPTVAAGPLLKASPPSQDGGQDEWITHLTVRWQGHLCADLKLRLETGAEINAHVGPPTARQDHGKKTLQEVATAIHSSVGECSRMRWFAHYFESVAAFEKKHPTVKTWTAVKGVIAQLNSKGGVRVQSAGGMFIKTIERLKSRVSNGEIRLNDTQLKELRTALAGFSKALEANFGTRLGSLDAGAVTSKKPREKAQMTGGKASRAK